MLSYLLEKEFKQFFRNRFLPKISVILPLVAMLIFPLIANFEIKNINLCVVDHDKSLHAQQLIQKIQSSGYFRITEVSDSYAQALKSVEENRSDMLIEIPVHFEKDLVKHKSARVLVAVNAVNGVKGGLGSSYLLSIINEFNAHIVVNQQTASTLQNRARFEVIPRFWYNPTLVYYKFMIPALMVMVLAIVSGFLPALNIVGEKESGTIEQMNVTPVKRVHFILSKLIPYWAIGFVVLTICFLVAWLAYGFLPAGSWLTIYLFTSVFILAFSGFGLIISNYAKTMQQAILMILFFVLVLVFLSGLYTPVNNMPGWAQIISHLSPLRYFIQVVRLVYLKGNQFSDMIPHFMALCGFAVLLNGWAVISYRKKS